MFSIRGCYFAFGNVAVFSPSKGGGVPGNRGIFGISVSKEIAAKTTLPLPNELLRCELQCSSCIKKKDKLLIVLALIHLHWKIC